MSQVGVLSLAQLQIHDHGDLNSGGLIATLARTDSATVKISNATARAMIVAAFVRMKQTVILAPSPGSMRVLFTLTRTGAAGTAHGQVRIYRGSTAIFMGADFSEVAGPTIETETAITQDLQALDTIEIWGYTTGGNCNIDTMQICYTGTITLLSRITLTAPLAVTGGDMPYQNIL